MNPFAEFLPRGERPRAHAQRIVAELREANRIIKRDLHHGMTQEEGEQVLDACLHNTPPSMHEWVRDYVRSHFQLAAARRVARSRDGDFGLGVDIEECHTERRDMER